MWRQPWRGPRRSSSSASPRMWACDSWSGPPISTRASFARAGPRPSPTPRAREAARAAARTAAKTAASRTTSRIRSAWPSCASRRAPIATWRCGADGWRRSWSCRSAAPCRSMTRTTRACRRKRRRAGARARLLAPSWIPCWRRCRPGSRRSRVPSRPSRGRPCSGAAGSWPCAVTWSRPSRTRFTGRCARSPTRRPSGSSPRMCANCCSRRPSVPRRFWASIRGSGPGASWR